MPAGPARRLVASEATLASSAIAARAGGTYTITVEPGLKFSDGTPVTADNFAYAINRVLNPLMAPQLTPFMDGTFGAGIVGAGDVESGKTKAASGVQVDGDKLIIKLERPSGEFLARLALPPFQALKTDMAINPQGISVYPSAGPYHITARAPNTSITLERNTHYTGTRPANADRIEYTIGNNLDVMMQRPDGLLRRIPILLSVMARRDLRRQPPRTDSSTSTR
jgi:peptide/nickel transport system substrate-binding protein